MKRAYEALVRDGKTLPDIAIIDGLYAPEIEVSCRPLVKADATVAEVMAASIVAKTARDRDMLRWSWIYPSTATISIKATPRPRIAPFCRELGPRLSSG